MRIDRSRTTASSICTAVSVSPGPEQSHRYRHPNWTKFGVASVMPSADKAVLRLVWDNASATCITLIPRRLLTDYNLLF